MGVTIINAVISSPAYSFSILKNIFFVFFSIILPLDGKNGINNARDWKEKKLVQVKTFGRENEALEPQLEEMKFI